MNFQGHRRRALQIARYSVRFGSQMNNQDFQSYTISVFVTIAFLFVYFRSDSNEYVEYCESKWAFGLQLRNYSFVRSELK